MSKDPSSSNPQAGQGRPLPKKEADLFKNVVKFYESKQYKKGLKNADTILKRFPNHGETLCMKGLILNGMVGSEKKVSLLHCGSGTCCEICFVDISFMSTQTLIVSYVTDLQMIP